MQKYRNSININGPEGWFKRHDRDIILYIKKLSGYIQNKRKKNHPALIIVRLSTFGMAGALRVKFKRIGQGHAWGADCLCQFA